MAANESTQNNATIQEQKGATEDPPANLVKQNESGKANSSEAEVPKEAVENYKQNGREEEE